MTGLAVPAALREQFAAHEPAPRVVLSYGLGADSTALLLRWIFDPDSRDFDLAELAVITAMVGDEWEDTARDVAEVVLPLLAQHRIRFIQVGRADRRVRTDGTGVIVFDDSRSPHRLYIEGAYTLGTEMLTAGTQPQIGGSRRCSMSAKGEVLDPVIAAITHGRPYRHVVGFEAGELTRARRDAGYDTALRRGEYPLISWGWDREQVLAYIREKTGRAWQKSACVFCPFALVTAANRVATLARYAAFPDAGARMLLMEHTALALNAKQGLVGGKRAIDYVRAAGLTGVLAAFESALAEQPHALYEVRRLARRTQTGGAKMVARSVRSVDVGSREEMAAWLDGAPLRVDIGGPDGSQALVDTRRELGDDGIARAVVPGRDGTGPHELEHFFVVAPAVVADKERPGFADWWAQATGTDLALFPISA
ncbi:hypothetical protein [Nocardia cyriacigeorgica]|uniref:hypothetical protein n=1 Tax=Nocardia cyriacigeorgica TaxID=135487 RepID=UPI0024572288|nr:hypothetical protein [Nocardia cyriacigeorgica]